MVAHRRLSSRAVAPNGIKMAVVAAYGDYVVRLVTFVPGTITDAVSPLWVELHDTFNDRGVDGMGCNDLPEAIAAAEEFLTKAKILNVAGTLP
jgi:hypothetical protein